MIKLYNFNRQPLYHTTSSVIEILESDTLKCGKVSCPKNTKAICFSRCSYYDNGVLLDKESCFDTLLFNKHNGIFTSSMKYTMRQKICFNTDLLIRDGYIPKPIDELAIRAKQLDVLNKIRCKSNPNNNKIVYNYHFNERLLLIEYEERIYKDIKNIHKYILFIEVLRLSDAEELCDILDSKGLSIPIIFDKKNSSIISSKSSELLERWRLPISLQNHFNN